MKKIIISNKQLDEAMTMVPKTNNPADIANMVNTGDTTKQQTIVNPNSNINSPVSKKNISITKDPTGKYNPNDIKAGMEKLGREQGSLTFVPTSDTGTSTTNTLMEKTYSKKHIEEVRKLSGRIMTKRELMESWMAENDDPQTIDDIIEKLRKETVSAENRLNDYIQTLGEISNELQRAVEEIKEALQRNGVNITGTDVNYYGDGFTIKIKTDWMLKGDGFYDDEEDEALYRALSNVTGAEYNYTIQQWGYRHPLGNYRYVHFGIEEGDNDCNPYFEISCDIPDLSDNREGY